MKAAHCSWQVRWSAACIGKWGHDRRIGGDHDLRSDPRTRPDSSSSEHTDPECRFNIWMADHAGKSASLFNLMMHSHHLFWYVCPFMYYETSRRIESLICDWKVLSDSCRIFLMHIYFTGLFLWTKVYINFAERVGSVHSSNKKENSSWIFWTSVLLLLNVAYEFRMQIQSVV